MIDAAQRICSLLPSATEIVYTLGLGDRLVAVTHECDFPSEARSKPHVTSSVVDGAELTAAEIDRAVRENLVEQATIYHLDRELLERLRPDLILTQELCDVCAVGRSEVQDVVAALSFPINVLSLEPATLQEVLDSLVLVGRFTGAMRRAIEARDRLMDRLQRVREAVAGRETVAVLCLEWMDPVFSGGHWVPEMVEVAGGNDVAGEAGKPSREVSWEEIALSKPDVIIAMPCGFGLDRAERELTVVPLPPAWHDLPAVRNGRVYAVDGSSYFNRPGPRLVDGVEILAAILHPDAWSTAPLESFRKVPLGAGRRSSS